MEDPMSRDRRRIDWQLCPLLARVFLGVAILVLAAAQTKADDVDLTVSVAPKNIRANNVTEKSSFFRSLGLPAFRDALSVVFRPRDAVVTPGDLLFPDGSSVRYGYGYRIAENAIIPYGAEFEYERRTGRPLALVGVYGCSGDLNCIDPSFPAMRVAVRNNGQRPLTVRQILVNVQKSERDLAPRFGVSFSPGIDDLLNPSGAIDLTNESRSPATGARLEFDLKCAAPDIAGLPMDGPLPFTLTARPGDLDNPGNPFAGAESGIMSATTAGYPQLIRFVFWHELSRIVPGIANVVRSTGESVTPDIMSRIRTLYGQSNCKPYLMGRLSGTYAGPNGAPVPFTSAVVTKVNAGKCCGGADSDFQIAAGRANLRSSGANYQLPIAVNRSILPGQEAMVTFDLTVDESSIHELSFQAVTDRGNVDSRPYRARLFVPWSSILFGRNQR
jgi:hypothetical protein